MSSAATTSTTICRRPANSNDLLDLRFPQKLWLLVNSPQSVSTNADDDASSSPTDLCVWSRNGTAIRVRLDRLDAYLAGLHGRSIFSTRLPDQWLRQLRVYGFQRLGGDMLPAVSAASSRASLIKLLQQPSGIDETDAPPLDVNLQEYRHELFRRDRPQLIDTIRIPAFAERTAMQQRMVAMLRHERHTVAERRLRHWDPCTRVHDRDSGMVVQQPRGLHLRTLLRDRAVREMLAQKLDRCARTNDCQIELESDVFENAADSVSGFEQREVAGYYGEDAGVRSVRAFFGDYLPTYANDEGGTSLMLVDPPPPPPSSTTEDASVMSASTGETKVEGGAASVADPFAIPQFQIVHNATAADPSQAYSLQMVERNRVTSSSVATDPVISSDYGARALANVNNFTPIHYDTSFLDVPMDFSDKADAADAVKDELLPPQEQANQTEAVAIDDDDDNFEIDQFFCMKPRATIVHHESPTQEQMHAVNDDDEIDPLDAELQAMQQDVDATLQNASSLASTPPTNHKACESTASEIIHRAAIIDDDFFSEIRESMDVLYDKML